MENSSVKLCNDLLIQILLRCNGKDVSRFKCVSKSWYVMISQDCIPIIFRRERCTGGVCFNITAQYPAAVNIRFTYSDTRKKATLSANEFMYGFASLNNSRLSCGVHEHQGVCTILNSCNGLLLYQNTASRQYYVCNPYIKQCVPIPIPKEHNEASPLVYAALAFDPSESAHYKIIRFTNFDAESLLIDMYFSDTGQWIRGPVHLRSTCLFGILDKRAVYFNRMIYQMSITSNHILCIDLNSMVGRVIELPIEKRWNCWHRLGVWKGRLCYVMSEIRSSMFIWSLEDHCKASFEWVLMHRISSDGMLNYVRRTMTKSPDEFIVFRLIGFCPNSNVIFIETFNMILSYNANSTRFEVVLKLPKCLSYYKPFIVVDRCLISLKRAGFMLNERTPSRKVPDGMSVLQLEKPSVDLECIPKNEEGTCMVTGAIIESMKCRLILEGMTFLRLDKPFG